MEVHTQDPPRLNIKEELVDLKEDESMDDEAGPSTRISNLTKRDSIAEPDMEQMMSESEVKKEDTEVDDDAPDYVHPGLANMEMVWVYDEKPIVGNPNTNTPEEDGDITLHEMEDLEERENLPLASGSSTQNIGKDDETTKIDFDNLETNFKRQQSNAHRLHKEIANYLRCSRALHSASRSLFDTFGEVYEPEWVGYDLLRAQAKNSDVIWTDLCHKIQDQTLEPLKAYVNQFPYMKKRIDRRGQKLLDYDNQQHQLEELQKADQQDEYKIARARDTLGTARTAFETLNKELYAELPIFYEQRIAKVAANLKTLCTAETVFMNENFNVKKTLEAIADNLVTEYAKGSYMTQRTAATAITNREVGGRPCEEVQFEETSINGTTTAATTHGDTTEIHPDTEELNNQEYDDDSSREQHSVPGPRLAKHRVHKVRKKFKCDHCEECFSKRSDLILHLPTHTGEKPFKCDQCQKCFNHRPSLTRHMRIHTDEKPYKCEHCEECFSQRSELINHVQTHTDEKPYKCKDCDHCFVLHSQLVTHMRTHSGEKPHMCNHCGKCFSHRMNLEVHMRTHTGEKPFKCEHCERCFSQRASLMKHLRTHTGEKPYKCKHCEKCFRRPETLVEHMRTHTGEKSFKCTQCGKCFRQRSHLVIHMRIHTGEKPFKCEQCGKCFSESGRLVVHMRTHTGEKPFKCDQCGKCYSQSSQLVVHVLTHTGEKPFMCDHCGKCYSQSSQLAGHVRTHTGEKPHKCDHCERCFNYHGDLIKHIRTHTGEKPYKCDHCGKCFSQSSHLVGHMRTHTGDKPFKCDHCESSFSDSSNLTKHIQSHSGDKLYKCVYCEKYFASGANLSKHMLVHNSLEYDEDGMPFQTTEDV